MASPEQHSPSSNYGDIPPSAQRPHTEQSAVSEQVYCEISETQTIPLKTVDGCGPLTASELGGAEHRSRPSSSGSDYLLGCSPDEDLEMLARNEVSASSLSDDLSGATVIRKPDIRSVHAAEGFKMAAAKPRLSIGTQSSRPPALLKPDHVQRVASPVQDSGYISEPETRAISSLLRHQESTMSPAKLSLDRAAPGFPNSKVSNHCNIQPGQTVQAEVCDEIMYDEPGKIEKLGQSSLDPPLTNISGPPVLEIPVRPSLKGVTFLPIVPRRRKPDSKSGKKKKKRPASVMNDIENPINISGMFDREPTPTFRTSPQAEMSILDIESEPQLPIRIIESPQPRHPDSLAHASVLQSVVEPSTNALSSPDLPELAQYSHAHRIPAKSPAKHVGPTDLALMVASDDVNVVIHDASPIIARSPVSELGKCSTDSSHSPRPDTSTDDPGLTSRRVTQGRAVVSRPMLARPQRDKERGFRTEQILHSQSGPAGLNRVSKPKQLEKDIVRPFICREDYVQLLESAFDDLKRQHLDEAARIVDTKEAELKQAVKVNETIKKQLQESQTQEQTLRSRVTDLVGKAARLTKFMNGLGSDMKSLGSIRAQLSAVIAETKVIRGVQEKQTEVEQQVRRFRVETLVTTQSLLQEKQLLSRKLSDMAGQLSEEKDRAVTLQRQLDKPKEEYIKLQEMLKEFETKTAERIAALIGLIGDGQKHEEILKLVKKCSEDTVGLDRQWQTNARNTVELKDLIEALGSATQKHFEDSISDKATVEEESLDYRVVKLLEAMKSDLRSQDDLTAKAAALQETIARLEERSAASEAKIIEINTQNMVYQLEEQSQRKHIAQLEATNQSSQHELSSFQDCQTQLQEVNTANGMLKERLAVQELETNKMQQQKQDLQQSLHNAESQLSEIRKVVPDFGPERAQLVELHKRRWKEHEEKISKQATELHARHKGEYSQAVKQTELVQKKLAAALAGLEQIQAENQLLKDQSQGNMDAEEQLRHAYQENERLKQTNTALQIECEEAFSTLQRHYNDSTTQREELKNMENFIEELQSVKQDLASSHEAEKKSCERADSLNHDLDEERDARKRLAMELSSKTRELASLLQHQNDSRSNRHLMSASAAKDYQQSHASQEAAQPRAATRRPMRKVDRTPSESSRMLRGTRLEPASQTAIEVPESERGVFETQYYDNDMLDDKVGRLQGSQTSSCNQILDGDDSRSAKRQLSYDEEETQQRPNKSDASERFARHQTPPTFETQSQAGPTMTPDGHNRYQEISSSLSDLPSDFTSHRSSSVTGANRLRRIGTPSWDEHGPSSDILPAFHTSPAEHSRDIRESERTSPMSQGPASGKLVKRPAKGGPKIGKTRDERHSTISPPTRPANAALPQRKLSRKYSNKGQANKAVAREPIKSAMKRPAPALHTEAETPSQKKQHFDAGAAPLNKTKAAPTPIQSTKVSRTSGVSKGSAKKVYPTRGSKVMTDRFGESSQ